MKAVITFLIVSMLFAGVLVAAGQDRVVDLSTLGKKPVMQAVSVTGGASTLSSGQEPLDLSTLNKKSAAPAIDAVNIAGATPITITPAFSITNSNNTAAAVPTVFTLPIAISSQTPRVYTPPIAIYGGA